MHKVHHIHAEHVGGETRDVWGLAAINLTGNQLGQTINLGGTDRKTGQVFRRFAQVAPIARDRLSP